MMERLDWYKDTSVMFEIVKQLKHREMAFKSVPVDPNQKSILTRYLKAFTIEFFQQHAERWDFWRMPKNLYASLAKYNYMPTFSFNIAERKGQREQWKQIYLNHVETLDLGMDFDAKNIKDAYTDAAKVKAMLDDCKVGYKIKASGTKGFHIVIPYENLPHLKDIQEQTLLHKEILETLHYEWGLKTLDLCVWNTDRIWKVAWSWDCKSDLIALPLTDEMFDNFRTDLCKPETVASTVKIANTALFERHLDLPEQDKVVNACDWIEHIDEKNKGQSQAQTLNIPETTDKELPTPKEEKRK